LVNPAGKPIFPNGVALVTTERVTWVRELVSRKFSSELKANAGVAGLNCDEVLPSQDWQPI